MRKLLVALMIVAFAATAFADIKLSGTYNVNGIYKNNMTSLDDGTTEDVNSYYEHEFKLSMKATTDKDTYFNAKLEIADNTWESDPKSDYAGETTSFQVERAYMGHNFGVAKLDVGLMDGGGWSYKFGNDVEGYYRAKATIPAGPGKIIAIVEKNYEANAKEADKDAEKDDTDSYLLGYTGKIAGLTLAPMVKYKTIGNKTIDQDTDLTVTVFDMGVGGEFGALKFEAEVALQDYAWDMTGKEDYTLYGAYADVSMKVAGANVGAVVAYGSYDDDGNAGYNFGDDFDGDTLFLIMGDEFNTNSNTEAGAYGLSSATVAAVYGDYSINDKLSLAGSIGYFDSNVEDDDTSAIEIDLGLGYAISEALSYNVAVGYAMIDDDADSDPAYMIKQGLTLSF